MKQILLTDPEKCDGCNDCIQACEYVNNESSIFLHKMDSGYHAIVCQQCINPSCIKGCFRDAIYREDGVVKIDQDRCIGCRLCMLMCP
ncbi:MAG TPA: 4Fe-4S binding protein, partial [Methanobacteriaceae archaeon]|nr:4Fe-4S binding protein [Methanobacteriaceae archaeon]